MASSSIVVEHMGTAGVNVDKNPLELDDNELAQSQNAANESTTGESSLQKRPGLLRFNTTATAGAVLGGCDLPVENQSVSGIHNLYIGRGAP